MYSSLRLRCLGPVHPLHRRIRRYMFYAKLTVRASHPGLCGSNAYLGISGNPYALDFATDLTPPINWVSLVTNTVDRSGAVEFLGTPGDSQGFFRARAAP